MTPAERIATKLIKVGEPYRTTTGWLTCCPGHSDQSPSLHISDGPNGQILFYCNTGCKWPGIRAGLEKAKLWPPDRTDEATQALGQEESPAKPIDDAERTKRALAVWGQGKSLPGSLSQRYLHNRRIELLNGTALRHHPACLFKGHGRHPTLLALFRTIDGDEPRAIQRIALLPDGSDRIREERDGWDGKWMLGPTRGCAVKLSRHAEVTDRLGICEGVETGLAVLCRGWTPIWAAGSAGAVGRFPLIAGIKCLWVFGDAGKDGEEAARKVKTRWIEAGRECRVLVPKDGDDWNTTLMREFPMSGTGDDYFIQRAKPEGGNGHHYMPSDPISADEARQQTDEQERAEAKSNGSGGAKTKPGTWFHLLKCKKGVPYPSIGNISIELQHDPHWQGVFYFDALQQQLWLEKPIPDRSGVSRWDGLPRPLQDTDVIAAVRWFSLGDYPTIGFDKIDMAVRELAEREYRRHPIRAYLDGLPPWDGQRRAGNWLFKYCAVDDQGDERLCAFIQAVGLKWLVSAIARIYQPGCKADHVLVLEGPQGVGKTSAFEVLGGEWFSDSLPNDLHSKDAAGHIRGKWIIEMAELGQLRKSETETVKSFITRRTERFRPAYGKHEVVYQRQCVFGGSTNSAAYLKDDTGGRRFWPSKVGKVDIDALRRDRDQIWAEAKHHYHAGEQWWLKDDGLIATANEQQAARRETDPWDDRVAVYAKAHPDGVTTAEVLGACLDIKTGMQSKRDEMRVASILKGLGLQSRQTTGGKRIWEKPTTSM